MTDKQIQRISIIAILVIGVMTTLAAVLPRSGTRFTLEADTARLKFSLEDAATLLDTSFADEVVVLPPPPGSPTATIRLTCIPPEGASTDVDFDLPSGSQLSLAAPVNDAITISPIRAEGGDAVRISIDNQRRAHDILLTGDHGTTVTFTVPRRGRLNILPGPPGDRDLERALSAIQGNQQPCTVTLHSRVLHMIVIPTSDDPADFPLNGDYSVQPYSEDHGLELSVTRGQVRFPGTSIPGVEMAPGERVVIHASDGDMPNLVSAHPTAVQTSAPGPTAYSVVIAGPAVGLEVRSGDSGRSIQPTYLEWLRHDHVWSILLAALLSALSAILAVRKAVSGGADD